MLAVEFSSPQRSAAVWEKGASAAGKLVGCARGKEGHRAIGLVEEALAQAGTRREEIGALAVGLGPGSYTGIRGAIALAQGWQLGREVKLVGISSVECLAAQAQAEGRSGAFNIVVDAQRNEFYLARYFLDEVGCLELAALRLATFAEIVEIAGSGEVVAGPDLAGWFPCAVNMCPDAAMLGKLAAGREDLIPGEKMEPIYLREAAFKKAPAPREIR